MTSKMSLARSSAALTACMLMLLAGSWMMASDDDEVTIVGEIVAAEYDDDNSTVGSVALVSNEMGTILVSNEGKGKELLDDVGAVVEITGKVVELEENENGFTYAISVTSYTIEVPADPDDE